MVSSSEYVVNRVPRSANVNLNKVDIFLRNRINSSCMLLLLMYTFIILTMRVYVHSAAQNELNEVSIARTHACTHARTHARTHAHTHTHTGPNSQRRRQSIT